MSSILGFGGYVPDRIMTNEDWAERLDTSDEWIRTRTGIVERRIAADDQSTVDLAEHAARRAIADAGLTVLDIDEIVIATDTQEVVTPDTAAFLQHRLGARPVPAYDLGGSGCAGFIQAMDLARARIMFSPRNVLVVGAEVLMRILSWDDRSTSVLFGDGAGAVIMGPGPGRAEVLDVLTGTDGSMTDILTVATGGTLHPFDLEAARSGAHRHLEMNGREVFRQAVTHMSDAVCQLLERNDLGIDDVALLIPHQANKRIIDAVGQRLGIDRAYVNVDRMGNTGSASIPIALSEAVSNGRVRPGDLVVLTAFGAGFHWGAAAIRFSD